MKPSRQDLIKSVCSGVSCPGCGEMPLKWRPKNALDINPPIG